MREPHHDDGPNDVNTAGQGPDDREDTLAEAFWSLARQLRRTSMHSLAHWDITPSQSRALRVLDRHGDLRLSDLAEHLGIAARSTTEIVDGLEHKGIAARRPDPTDRRATLVTLTDTGVRLVADIRSSRVADADRVFARLTDHDRQELARILRTLRD